LVWLLVEAVKAVISAFRRVLHLVAAQGLFAVAADNRRELWAVSEVVVTLGAEAGEESEVIYWKRARAVWAGHTFFVIHC
jgi:hypothetical protein